jgi:hypothetical protein
MARRDTRPDPKEAALAGGPLPEPAPGAGDRPGVPGQRLLRRPGRGAGQVRDGAQGPGPAAPRSPRPPRRSGTPGRRTTPRPPRWSPRDWTGWCPPARAARRQQAHRGDPRLGRGAAGRRPALRPAQLPDRSRRPSACACTPARSSERWPAAAAPLQKPRNCPPARCGRRITRPCPCSHHLATRLLNQAPARMPARTVPPAAG